MYPFQTHGYKVSVKFKADIFSKLELAFGIKASAPGRNAAIFSRLRFLISPWGHMWQYLQSTPLEHPLGFQNHAHGWHVVVMWRLEPLLGSTCRCDTADVERKQSTGVDGLSSIVSDVTLVLLERESSSEDGRSEREPTVVSDSEDPSLGLLGANPEPNRGGFLIATGFASAFGSIRPKRIIDFFACFRFLSSLSGHRWQWLQ